MTELLLGDRAVGDGHPTYVIAEIGINHNGDLDLARRLISAAVLAGADAVKFQKRTVDVVYTPEELERPRENPFGDTNGDLKYGLEFGADEFSEIHEYAKMHSIPWTASCWDEGSVEFMEQYDPAFYKIASASLTDDALLRRHVETGKPMILSTGMSTLAEIDHAVDILGTDKLVILHCTSTYPSDPSELNLECIPAFKERYGVPIGYSGHETGLATSVAAVALGACVLERHLTLDRAMWGSDQAASVEPQGFARLVRDAHTVDTARGDGVKVVYESEVPIREKLRRVG